jgi:hypothetical protein
MPLSAFDPPSHPSGMQALLEDSIQTYGSLLSDLRPQRMHSRAYTTPEVEKEGWSALKE